MGELIFKLIYDYLFIASVLYVLYVILMFVVKWIARFKLKLDNEKFILTDKMLTFLLFSLSMIVNYIIN